MVGTSSSSTQGPSVFSLDSQAGVVQLLSSIRASDISSKDKNELRDLIFLYTNGGHDESVRLSLEQKLANHHIKPVAQAKKQEPDKKVPEQPTIGTFRQPPSFSVSSADIERESQSQSNQSESSAPHPESRPEPVAKVVQNTPANIPVKTVSEMESTPKDDVPTSSGGIATPEANLERIREIKSLVNQKIGNPVHLVEANPEVGREYMSALLEAMKQVNTGASATAAMSRLEKAFEIVAKLPEDLQTKPSVAAVPSARKAPISDISAAAARASVLAEEEQQQEVVESRPVVQPATAAPQAVQEQPKLETKPPMSPVVNTPQYTDFSQNEKPQNATPPVRVPIQPPHTAQQKTDSLPISSTPRTDFATQGHDEQVTPQVLPVGKSAEPNRPPISPVSTLSNPLVKGKTEATSETDPLHSAEVDAGLEQLLEEWPIFKKSGLFGTGPKGREHPLFKKVAELQIPLLLAGRFEGATQEIKQSITDYMNGWRYEQGIIYEQGETFEHYLRRVIRHILDLQKNRI